MMTRLLLAATLPVISCTTDLQSNSHEQFLHYGSVRDVGTGATLVTFCGGGHATQSDVIVFSAPTGSVVEEEVFFEGRTEKYQGAMPPERDQAFWCSASPEVYLRPVNYWTCLRASDPDPPATISSIERRGVLGVKETSSGYALKLEVRHPGVLRLIFDPACVRSQSDSFGDAAGTPVPHAELTIL
jgi:hypothetical protein